MTKVIGGSYFCSPCDESGPMDKRIQRPFVLPRQPLKEHSGNEVSIEGIGSFPPSRAFPAFPNLARLAVTPQNTSHHPSAFRYGEDDEMSSEWTCLRGEPARALVPVWPSDHSQIVAPARRLHLPPAPAVFKRKGVEGETLVKACKRRL